MVSGALEGAGDVGELEEHCGVEAAEATGATPRITPCASRSRRGVDWAAGEAGVKGRRHGSGADLRRPFTTTRPGSACALVTFLDEGVTVRAHPPLRPDRAGRGPAAPTPCRRVESLRGAQRRRLLCPPISRLLAHLPSPVLAACEAASDGLRGEGPSCTCSAAPPPAGGFTPRESRAARVPATPSELGVTGRAAEPGSVARELLLARLAARHLVPSLTRRACRRGRAARRRSADRAATPSSTIRRRSGACRPRTPAGGTSRDSSSSSSPSSSSCRASLPSLPRSAPIARHQ